MDMVIIKDTFPTCSGWRDVAWLVKGNLNPRTLHTHLYRYNDAVLETEIVAFFRSAGLEHDQAQEAVDNLCDLGFIERGVKGICTFKF